jgi:ferredoxin-NADP reductase
MSNLMAAPEAGTSATIAGNPRTIYVATIERIFEHTPDTRSFFLRLPQDQYLAFKPGQFISLLLPVGDTVLTRPYSIASNPEEGNLLEICLNLVAAGPGSHYLFARNIGETLCFTGPWGTLVLDQLPEVECVFIADGTGIAPIRPMIHRALTSRPHFPLRLLYRALKASDLLYHEEWKTSARECSWFTFEPLLSNPPKGWTGSPGSLIEYVEQRYVSWDNDRSRLFYICGVGQQVIQLRDLLRRAGYQRRAVQYEKW